jgi:hypothetical protein
MLRHALSATGARPSAKWLKTGRELGFTRKPALSEYGAIRMLAGSKLTAHHSNDEYLA